MGMEQFGGHRRLAPCPDRALLPDFAHSDSTSNLTASSSARFFICARSRRPGRFRPIEASVLQTRPSCKCRILLQDPLRLYVTVKCLGHAWQRAIVETHRPTHNLGSLGAFTTGMRLHHRHAPAPTPSKIAKCPSDTCQANSSSHGARGSAQSSSLVIM